MSSLSVPDRRNGSSDALRPTLAAFEPVTRLSGSYDERPESSASGSRRNPSIGGSREGNAERRSLSSTTNTRDDAEKHGSPLHSRRTSQRSSGGFLLGSIARSSRIPRPTPRLPEDLKGKRKSEDSQLSIPKRRVRHAQMPSDSSPAGSPLATEVHRDAIPKPQDENGRLIPGTDVRQSTSAQRSATMSSGSSSGQRLEIMKPSPPIFGYDTDPSQIVNMALSLGEARRRQASMKRYVSSDQSGRRIISTASSTPHRSRLPIGSIAQYLTPSTPVSATTSIKGRPETPQIGQQQPDHHEGSPADEMDIDESRILAGEDISEATAARVQRARTYFELAYEHRRLLSHLPPIRRPGSSVRSTNPDLQTKAYNPLQYIRNRKLRIWDKTTFNAEAEGWHDVEQVRKWVDAVIESHRETRHDPSECVRLPLLSRTESNMDEECQEVPKERPVTQPNEQPKPRRPRSDWITHPGDMLADCFWLEQSRNKIKIRDRDNNQIYPPDTQFKFSSWRNRPPVDVPAILQQPTPPPEETEEADPDPIHSPAPELPTFKSAHDSLSRGVRGKKSSKIKDSSVSMDESGNRRKGLRLFMHDSSDDSGSDRSPGSSGGEKERGRKRLTRKRQQKQSSSRSPATAPLSNTITRDSIFASTLSPSDGSQPSSAPNSKRASIDHSRFGRYLKRDSIKERKSRSRSQNRADHDRQESTTIFPSSHDRPRSSAEYDSTAPNSPVTAVWPSIAINLESPRQSRSPSPTKKKSSILNPFRDRTTSTYDKVSATDFADLGKQDTQHPNDGAEKQQSGSSHSASRGTSPMTRGQSPLSKPVSQSTQNDSATTPGDHRGSGVSRVSAKSTAPSSDHSRIRGMFKGGRIAELVGNEVSRVGDFIWKRDLPTGYKRRGSTSSASDGSRHDIQIEEAGHVNGDVYKTPPPRPRVRSSRASTISSTKSEKFTSPVSGSSKSPGSGEKPKYNNPNLPSFTSPFERDKEVQEQRQQALLTPTTPPGHRDHISRLAAEHRSRSRSPRLDRLAPPKLDTGGVTSPDGLSQQKSYGFSAGLDLSRSRDASDKYNDAIGDGARSLRETKSATDLSRVSTAELSQQPDEPEKVARRDIDRATALLLCSAVKAREIGRRADNPRKQAPKFLLETMAADGADHHHVDLSLVSRREEHVVAARVIMSRLSTLAMAFDEKMQRFSTSMAPALHTELQSLEDLVDNKMTPRVRRSADEAGELSMKLTTTSTMAVKGLNDAINDALRRRRRGPIRWVRRLWYASIEYFVVSLLWGIWAVVTLIRIVLAVARGTTRALRWLLWID